MRLQPQQLTVLSSTSTNFVKNLVGADHLVHQAEVLTFNGDSPREIAQAPSNQRCRLIHDTH